MKNIFEKNKLKSTSINTQDDFCSPWVTDIEGVTTGQFGAGYYDFAEFRIGDHTILVEACNGYHISIDVPTWFEPSTDDWPQIIVNKRWKVMEAIQYIIDKINKNEGTNLTLKFKRELK